MNRLCFLIAYTLRVHNVDDAVDGDPGKEEERRVNQRNKRDINYFH